jgi:hypothetical protein
MVGLLATASAAAQFINYKPIALANAYSYQYVAVREAATKIILVLASLAI